MKVKDNLKTILFISGATVSYVYITNKEDSEQEDGLIYILDNNVYSGWDMAHFALHFLITSVDYNNWKYSVGLSLAWEAVEKSSSESYWQDSSTEDFKINTLGMLTGMAFNKYLLK